MILLALEAGIFSERMSLRRWLGVAPSSLLGGARLLTSGTGLPDFVRLVEVGPRDGLQNEPTQVETVAKLNLIGKLAESGLRTVEATAFVSPKWVPQMADHKEVLSHVMAAASGSDFSATSFPVLVPNLRGIESAVKCGATEVAVFASASETFSKRNINCTVEESLERFRPVFDCARANGVRVRGYVSCVVGCPYEGAVSEKAVSALARDLVDMGCYEVSLGDTIGVGSPGSVERMLREVARDTSPDRLAVHFHDTYGQALANILTSLRLGIR